jgi:multiple sugar transport system permease protein
MASTSSTVQNQSVAVGGAQGFQLAHRLRTWVFAHALILPALAVILFLVIYPLVRIIDVSFRQGKMMSFARIGEMTVGFGNYVRVLTDSQFWHAVQVSAIYVVVSVGLAFIFALFTALLLDSKLPGQRVFRTLFLLPWAVPGVVASIVFSWMFDGSFGVINGILRYLGLIDGDINWVVDSRTALFVVILPTVWKAYPLITLTILAALQTIPRELYEASSVDGANPIQRFRYVTWPGIAVAGMLASLISALWVFRDVEIVFASTGGGPAGATETLSLFVYNQAFQYFQMGVAAAAGVLMITAALLVSGIAVSSVGKDKF